MCCHNPIQTNSRHLGENDNQLTQSSKDIDSIDSSNDVKSVFFLLNHLVESNRTFAIQNEESIFVGSVFIATPEGSAGQPKNSLNHRFGPRRCLAFLFIFELGNMACGCIASAPQ